MYGGGGGDLIALLGGSDTAHGGDFADIEDGGDLIGGGSGNDFLYGWEGDDYLNGGDAFDLLSGGGFDSSAGGIDTCVNGEVYRECNP